MNKDQLELKELSREQILDLADASGAKLGVLLAASGLEDDVKEAIVGILQYATPAQLDEFINLFERTYLEEKNKTLINILASKLNEIKNTFNAKQTALDNETLKRLEKIVA